MSQSSWRTPFVVLAFGSALLAVSVGIRHGFGLFLQPMSIEHAWGREIFGLAIAIQNLVWGATQPFTGMLADRYGAGRTAIVGCIFYVAGLVLMAHSHSALMLVLSAGVLIGVGLSCTTFATVFAAIGRSVPPEKRSMALGISGAVGSFGQFLFMPIELGLISWFGWSMALMLLAVMALLIIPLSTALFEDGRGSAASTDLTIIGALREASRHRGFILLSAGYFVCGFHITFIGTHLPAYLADKGLSAGVATMTLALVGLVNVLGSYMAGVLGSRWRKPLILTWIYAFRAVSITIFAFVVPLSEWSAYAFGVAMGLTWLATVPLTSGTVASIFGVKNMSMLAGITFFCHQVGAFLGGWMGGRLYDTTGSYDIVWMVAIGLGVVAALLSWPVSERTVARLAPAA
jgi:MFS family permease